MHHFEQNLKLRIETRWAELGYFKMVAPRVSRFPATGQGDMDPPFLERRLSQPSK